MEALGLQSLCDNLRTFAPVVASAREGESVEAWAFRPAKKGREKGGFSPGPSPLNFPGL